MTILVAQVNISSTTNTWQSNLFSVCTETASAWIVIQELRGGLKAFGMKTKKNYGQILQYPPYVNARPADLQSTKYLLQNFEPKIEWAERYAMAAYSRIESIV